MPTPPRRRWYQVRLAESLILTTLLGVTWWQCVRWPIAVTVSKQVQVGQFAGYFMKSWSRNW